MNLREAHLPFDAGAAREPGRRAREHDAGSAPFVLPEPDGQPHVRAHPGRPPSSPPERVAHRDGHDGARAASDEAPVRGDRGTAESTCEPPRTAHSEDVESRGEGCAEPRLDRSGEARDTPSPVSGTPPVDPEGGACAGKACERAAEDPTLAEAMLALLAPPPPAAARAGAAAHAVAAASGRAQPMSGALPAAPQAPYALPAANPAQAATAPAASAGDHGAALAGAARVGPGALAAFAGEARGRVAVDATPVEATLQPIGSGHDTTPPAPAAPLFSTVAFVRPGDPTTAIAVPATVALPATPDDGFDDSFGQRIVWMVEQRIGQAEMRVSPEGIGAIDVRLQLDGNRLTAQFSAAHADVRQALEAGMGRLRDLLGQHGVELADAHVGREGSGRQPGGRDRSSGGMPHGDDPEPRVTTLGAMRARGLIDLYA